MQTQDILRLAEQAALDAVKAQYGHSHPSPESAAGDYFRLVFSAAAAHLERLHNGVS